MKTGVAQLRGRRPSGKWGAVGVGAIGAMRLLCWVKGKLRPCMHCYEMG